MRRRSAAISLSGKFARKARNCGVAPAALSPAVMTPIAAVAAEVARSSCPGANDTAADMTPSSAFARLVRRAHRWYRGADKGYCTKVSVDFGLGFWRLNTISADLLWSSYFA